MRRQSLWLAAAAAIVVSLTVAPVLADSNPETATTSHWQVYAWIGQNVQSGIMTMTTTGDKVVATLKNLKIHGTLVDYGNQMNATYTGPRGEGWITLTFHNEGDGFGGQWGLKAKPADGKFVGSRVSASATPAATQ